MKIENVKIWKYTIWQPCCLSTLNSPITSELPDGLFSSKKNHNLDKFWRALDWKMLIYFKAIDT
jgi:hypothetical protein